MSVGVCMSILQPVTKEWLLEVCERHRYGLSIPNEGVGLNQDTLEMNRCLLQRINQSETIDSGIFLFRI